ncbi:MAG: tRNA (N(6)-L-threonylcarbamoyladenosine(37)-C(2))-methylthiotransferase MtaB [bacterium]|nr:tRNA (N(6)-L-threonylcarbamoyladenosine(37)-C(2))-methylthiotransferase MtaB [bacterium]
MLKISFYTLGCRSNKAETSNIIESFKKTAFEIVPFNKPADILVINSCTVTAKADRDTKKIINKTINLNPEVKIALIGCLSEIQQDKLLKLPNIFWVIGNADKMNLASIVKNTLDKRKPSVVLNKIKKESFTIKNPGIDKKYTRANIKIQDGCDNYCSYCIIPYSRGPARSREFEDIINEAAELCAAGYREIVITGINAGSYNYNNKNILDVIKELETIPDLERIRISSIESTDVIKDIIDRMSVSKKLCRFLHISLQSGCDKILSFMNRDYTTDYYRSIINYSYNNVPGICIGTDIIAGFPGETDIDFNQTKSFVESLPFTYFHVFSYSDRKKTKSFELNPKTPSETIKRRTNLLRALSNKKREFFLSGFLNKTLPVLFEEQKNDLWTGLTDNYIRVNVKSNQNLENKIYPVVITDIADNTVKGNIILNN